MLATQSEDMAEITAALINTINDCIVTDGIKAEELPQAEAELLLLNMRSKSVGEKVSIVVTDPEDEDGKSYPVDIDLSKITVEVAKDFENVITFEDGTVVEFNLPNIKSMEDVEESDNEFDSTMTVLTNCVKAVTIDEECINRADLKDDEIREFLLDMSSGDFKLMNDKFFSKIPQLATTVKIKRADGTSFSMEVSGLGSFF